MEFEKFQKIPRYKRNIVITEQLDGTNAQVAIMEAPAWGDSQESATLRHAIHSTTYEGVFYYIFAGSRTRWLTLDADNYGFARWVVQHTDELIAGLGEGRHYGEWWGQGIQRRYGLDHKRFSLFNTGRWLDNPDKPECCHVVPVLYEGPQDATAIEWELVGLRAEGSQAAPGFMNPEGIIVYHAAGRNLYKVTLDGDAAKGE